MAPTWPPSVAVKIMTESWYERAKKMGLFDKTYQHPNDDPRLPSALSGVTYSPDRTSLYVRGVDHRVIMSAPGYFISETGVVRNVHGRRLRVRTPTYGQPNVQLSIGLRRNVKRRIEDLLSECWPGRMLQVTSSGIEYDGETWLVIPEFPKYMMNRSGVTRKIETRAIVKISGESRILMLRKDGDAKQYGRSAAKIRRSLFGA